MRVRKRDQDFVVVFVLLFNLIEEQPLRCLYQSVLGVSRVSAINDHLIYIDLCSQCNFRIVSDLLENSEFIMHHSHMIILSS